MTDEKQVPLAVALSKEQRQISVSTFFLKNKHLLGFDNPIKALATTVKEMVDNSLDATQDMKVLPEIKVEIKQLGETRFIVIVEDNGPGIVKEQIPKVFARLLYGSKFFKAVQQRGQQGLGVSASVLYGQLTTGKPAKITSKIDPKHKAHYYELHIDTEHNEPEILKDEAIDWKKNHGTKVEIEMEAKYQKGRLSVDEYLKQTAISNPHAQIVYINPKKEKIIFKRGTNTLPKEPKEIKPHPYGVELGILIAMIRASKARNLKLFLISDFSRVSDRIAKEISLKSGVSLTKKLKDITRGEVENIFRAIQDTKIMAPPTNCLSPIGENVLINGLKKEVKADFYAAVTRSPSVYRGFPFQIEIAACYGGDLLNDDLIRVIRFANRVPLLYQQSGGAIFRSVVKTSWRNYGLSQSRGALPVGPVILVVHIASVWVPFTSESKEAVAHYPEIIKEIKLGLQDVGRKLGSYIRKKKHAQLEAEKKGYIKKYLPYIGEALGDILNLKENQEKKIENILKDILEKSRK